MERDLLLFALGVQFARGYREHEVGILFVIDNFERQATESKVFFFGVFARVSLPLLRDGARRVEALFVSGLPIDDTQLVIIVEIILLEDVILVSVVDFGVLGLRPATDSHHEPALQASQGFLFPVDEGCTGVFLV